MCLEIIDATELEPDGVGYKVLKLNKKSFSSIIYRMRWRKNKWKSAREEFVNADEGGAYLSGFHIYTNLKDANREAKGFCYPVVIVQIEYRGAHTIGKQWGTKVVVAPKARLISVIKKVKNDFK
jgi:hypothetical protein